MEEFSRGMHIIVDAYEVEGKLQRDFEGIVRFLNELPPKIGMRVLREAQAVEDKPPACPHEDRGISGDVLLAESHATIHCWPERGELQFDLYSCKPYDPYFVLDELVTAFGIGDWDMTLVPRRRR